ncbi:hypothetical protein ILYODFUR_008602 [Ilyodon furcidens]|uniref:Uncharacterized protein n=1 Tax=Ilyodon furcidens TaxID=33524 RepID=A0ABV0UT66_9TELE
MTVITVPDNFRFYVEAVVEDIPLCIPGSVSSRTHLVNVFCSVLEICVIITVSLCMCMCMCVRVRACVCHMYRDVLPIFMYIKPKYRTNNPCVTLGVKFFLPSS